jgi:hypothetical protein
MEELQDILSKESKSTLGWGSSLVVKYLYGMCKALGLIPALKNN